VSLRSRQLDHHVYFAGGYSDNIQQQILISIHYDLIFSMFELTGMVSMLKDFVTVVVIVVTMWPLSEAQLNPVEAAALFDLCDRPGTDLWTNCNDSANACINSVNWTGITCNANKTAIVNMYDTLIGSLTSFVNLYNTQCH